MSVLDKKQASRYKKLAMVLTQYGFEDLIAASGLFNYLPVSYLEKHQALKQNLEHSTYERIRMVLEELGPTYIKFGQIFSNREDLLPKQLLEELTKLQDKVPARDSIDIRVLLEAEFEIDPNSYFQQIEEEPLAAASIAQVYRATLTNGEKVVFKVQRPDIKEVIEADIEIMKSLAKTLESYSATLQSFQPVNMVETFEESILEELDFTRELYNLERFAQNFEDEPYLHVPRAYKELSNRRIICMEYIEGIKISNVVALDGLGVDRKELAKVGVDLYLKQVLEFGFFHADPHPGNLFFLPDREQLCFIDFGMMGRILTSERELLEDLILYFVRKDTKKIISTVERIAIKCDIADRKKVEYELNKLLGEADSMKLQDIKLEEGIGKFKEILTENKVVLPHYLYMLMRALLIIDAIGLKLDPEYSLMSNVEPYITSIISRRFSPKRIFNKLVKRFEEIYDLVDNLPSDLKEILEKTKRGELKIKHEVHGLEEMRDTIQKASNRLVLAVIIAALSIGSSILVFANMPPKIYNVPFLGFVGFIISGLLSLRLAYSIFKSGKY
ncbi:AarF/ABC1/UbiB kinase family protein [Flavobacterium sp. NRK F10]|uniref:ABC1 kinase family protein n=1 Tax=Flavobacterium sp. NRK F10 TaxID=2954931 RepID=UPI002090B124|nr:AarF/ABC1/UbiB kinase family protein [Flavobacterium sp. NRK F10]MCO6175963.1 AarF/ABC1/UbiB kinase family protein [Flavobacterium sp. NRK F10]